MRSCRRPWPQTPTPRRRGSSDRSPSAARYRPSAEVTTTPHGSLDPMPASSPLPPATALADALAVREAREARIERAIGLTGRGLMGYGTVSLVVAALVLVGTML